MADVIVVDGPARLYLFAHGENGPSLTLPANLTGAVELGITETGVQVSLNQLTHRVNSDDCGGSEGSPAEFILLGATASIKGTLVKYNSGALATVASGLFNGGGTIPLPGTPLFAAGYGFSLYVNGFASSWYFPRCEMASQPREFNLSTTERKTSFTITAYPCGGVLYVQGAGGNANAAQCIADAIGGSLGGN